MNQIKLTIDGNLEELRAKLDELAAESEKTGMRPRGNAEVKWGLRDG